MFLGDTRRNWVPLTNVLPYEPIAIMRKKNENIKQEDFMPAASESTKSKELYPTAVNEADSLYSVNK